MGLCSTQPSLIAVVVQRSAPGPTQWAAVLWGVAKAGRPCTDLQVLDAEGLRTGATFLLSRKLTGAHVAPESSHHACLG